MTGKLARELPAEHRKDQFPVPVGRARDRGVHSRARRRDGPRKCMDLAPGDCLTQRLAVPAFGSCLPGTMRPPSLCSICDPDQSCCREPVTAEMRGSGSQMKLPNYPNSLPSEQPSRDRLE